MSARTSSSLPSFPVQTLWLGGTLIVALLLTTRPAHAAFHLWTLREVYSDSSGTLQFVELFCPSSGQQFVGGQQITVTNVGGTQTHAFTIPSNLPGDTLNHSMLLATTGADANGAPTPDFFIPSSFLFQSGGTISFFGANSGTYTALPTDGTFSRTWGDGNAVNTPRNFAGQTGLVVPDPESLGVMGCVGAVAYVTLLGRRRETRSESKPDAQPVTG